MSVATAVAPFTGAWIEILKTVSYGPRQAVAPFTGAWIEIMVIVRLGIRSPVAPFTGAWIEIQVQFVALDDELKSLPSRERGLKSFNNSYYIPRAGRSLHGSVD